MALQLTDPIIGYRVGFDYAEIVQRLDRPDKKDREFAERLQFWCMVSGIDSACPFAQWLLETDNARSVRWNRDLNASGMGIVSDGTAQPFKITSVDESARIFIQCLYSLVNRAEHPDIPLEDDVRRWFDRVWLPKVTSQAMPTVRTVGDLGLRYTENGDSRATWSWEDGKAPMDTYGKKLISRLAQFYPGLPNQSDPPVTTPATPEEPVEQEPKPMPNVFRRVPHPPFVDLPVWKPAGGGYGYTQIPTGSRRIVGVMNHETQGRGSGPWYRDFFSCPGGQRCADALVDYLITRDGTIYRLNDPKNNRSPWANGGPLGLEGDGPAFYARFGASGVNNSLISIEYEKLDNEDFTAAQIQSGGLLNAYWHDQDDQDWESYPYVPRYGCVTSLAHFEIGTTNCGKGELPGITKIQSVARGEMKRCQTMADGPSVPSTPSVPSQPEIPTLPGGAVLSSVVTAFGTLTKHTPDGKTKVAPFDPKGIISLSYTHRCVEAFGLDYTKWPKAEDWWALTDSGKTLDIVTFSNEWQLIRTAERQGIMWARFADAELEAIAA